MGRKKTVVKKDLVEEALVGIAREAFRMPIKPATGMVLGVGAMVGLIAVQKYAPRMAGLVGRVVERMTAHVRLLSAMQEHDAALAALRGHEAAAGALGIHPEAAEPRTPIDERQLGRSEVINEITRGKMN